MKLRRLKKKSYKVRVDSLFVMYYIYGAIPTYRVYHILSVTANFGVCACMHGIVNFWTSSGS